MTEFYFVKLADPKMILRDPRTKKVMPVEGLKVRKDSFWIRRIASGEVILVNEISTEEKGE